MKLFTRIFIALAIIFCWFSVAPAKADEVVSTVSNVTVLPAKFDLSSSSGQTINQSLKIINNSDTDYLFALSVDNISVTGENGEVGIGEGNTKLSNLLSSWIKADEPSGKLDAHTTKIIAFQIRVPEQVEPGGKYASIVISLDKAFRNSGESSAIAKVVSLVMLKVAGDYPDEAKLLNFDISKEPSGKTIFTSRIRNQGISHVKPEGSIIVSNIFGQKVAEISFEGDNVLPGSVRRTTTEWVPARSLFGIYTATFIANYGQKNDMVITASKNLSNFPLLPTSLALLAIIAIVFAALSLARHSRQN